MHVQGVGRSPLISINFVYAVYSVGEKLQGQSRRHGTARIVMAEHKKEPYAPQSFQSCACA